jgi:hypothetical protein
MLEVRSTEAERRSDEEAETAAKSEVRMQIPEVRTPGTAWENEMRK